jgi:integrase
VDLRRGKLHIRRSRTRSEDNAPKTKNSARVVALLPEVVAVLRPLAFQRTREDAFVFTTAAETPLEAERFVDKHWRAALRACRVRPRKLYNARHTFISLALTRGVNLKWLARYCGTSVEMIEKHYGKWMDGDDGQLALLTAPVAATPSAPEAQVA